MIAFRQTAAALRREIQDTLALRAPKALTPHVRLGPERNSSGVEQLDLALHGGIPVGAITEFVGQECTGRTTMALAYVAASLQAGNVAAWVDVNDVLDPVSAAECGVALESLLWVRCVQAQNAVPTKKRDTVPQSPYPISHLPFAASGASVAQGSGGSPHPRSEGRGMDQAIQDLLTSQPRSSAMARARRAKMIGTPSAPNRPLSVPSPERGEQIPSDRLPSRRAAKASTLPAPSAQRSPAEGKAGKLLLLSPQVPRFRTRIQHEWSALDQALKATDLILQSGGFGMIVLDLGSTPAQMSWRIPLASWFRFRAACERTRTSLLLLTRHPCARSSAELTMRLKPGHVQAEGGVLTDILYLSEVERVRFQYPESNVLPLRKPPQPVRPGQWKGRAAWAT